MELETLRFGHATVAVPKNWVDNSIINFLGPKQGNFQPNLVVTERPVAGKPSVAELGERQKQSIVESGLEGLELIAHGAATLGKRRVYRLAYAWELADGEHGKLRLRQEQCYEIRGQRVLVVTLTCRDVDHAALAPTFEAILESTNLSEGE